MKCDNCVYCGTPEMLIEEHFLKENSYTECRIIRRCLATTYKYAIGCVSAEVYCKFKKLEGDTK